MIEHANINDIDCVMEILKDVIAEMKSYGNTQWDDNYPKRENFLNDIENKKLYVIREDEILKGFVCLDFTEPSEYEAIKWRQDKKALVLHRMAIAAECRNQGVALKLMNFTKQLAREEKVNYVKTDTYSLNNKMNSLFVKVGFVKVGEMDFLKKEFKFYCYDMILDN